MMPGNYKIVQIIFSHILVTRHHFLSETIENRTALKNYDARPRKKTN